MSSTSPDQKLQAVLPDAVADKIPHIPESKEELKADAKAAASTGLAQVRSFVAGGFGGVCAVVVGHPFDLVKVRLQTAEKGVYSSAIDVVKKSVAKDGLKRGLYAGVSAPLVGVTPMCEYSLSSFFSEARMLICYLNSRRLLLGLRPRQEHRPLHLYRQPRWQPLHCPDFRRRFLLRHPHDRHYRPL